MIQQRRQEVGSPPDPDLSRLECSVETYDPGAAVLTVGGYELDGFSYYLALHTADRWTPVAKIGEKETPGTGGHYSEFEVEQVRAIERGGARFLWVQGRSNEGYWHFDGSQGSFDRVQVTLCRLPASPGEPVACPLQVPILIEREWSDPNQSDEGAEKETEGHAAESNPLGEVADDSELDSSLHEETVRLEIRISDDGATAEVVLVEGELEGGALEEMLGVHPLLDE